MEQADCDTTSRRRQHHHLLPISCEYCPYTLCYKCFKSNMAKGMKRCFIECPSCGNGIGFYVTENGEPSHRNISPFACALLHYHAQAEDQAGAVETSGRATSSRHSDDGTKIGGDGVARMPPPSSHNDDLDDSIPAASSDPLQLDDNDSKMPAVTQSQPDDDDDIEETESEASTSNEPTAAMEGSAQGGSHDATSTPSRKRKSSQSPMGSDGKDDEEETSTTAAVVTPPKKKKRRIVRKESDTNSNQCTLDSFFGITSQAPSREQANNNADDENAERVTSDLEITDEERQALKKRSNWMNEFGDYLRNNLGLTEVNLKRVIDAINNLRFGYGINYAPQKQEPIKFLRNIKIDLSMDLNQVFVAAEAFEKVIGKDKSHGWKVRHPITKLTLFQEHVVKQMRSSRQSNNDDGDDDER